MHRASFERLHEVLRTLESVRSRRRSQSPVLRINYTVNEENLKELERFFEVFGKYRIKTLQVRPIIDFGGSYRTLLTKENVQVYDDVIRKLLRECTTRGVTFLVNFSDPTYEEENYSSMILQAVRRHITPQVVWREDFNWKTETYEEFCSRIGWRKRLLQSVVSSKDEVVKNNAGLWGKHAAKYEVIS
jgi:hypothetical protein